MISSQQKTWTVFKSFENVCTERHDAGLGLKNFGRHDNLGERKIDDFEINEC